MNTQESEKITKRIEKHLGIFNSTFDLKSRFCSDSNIVLDFKFLLCSKSQATMDTVDMEDMDMDMVDMDLVMVVSSRYKIL